MGLYVDECDFVLDKCIKRDPEGHCSVYRGRMRNKDVGIKVMRIFDKRDMVEFLLSAWSYGLDATLRDTAVMTRNLAFNEMYFLYKFSKNPFFGTLKGYYINYTLAELYLFTEWVENETLANLIIKSASLSLIEFMSVYFQILFLVEMLNAMGITHCDLHAENILVTTYTIETSFERYITQDGREFFLPNCGKRVIIWDMTFARAETAPCLAAVELVDRHRQKFGLKFKAPLFEDLHFVMAPLYAAVNPTYRVAADHILQSYEYQICKNRGRMCDLINAIFYLMTVTKILLDDSPKFDFRVAS